MGIEFVMIFALTRLLLCNDFATQRFTVMKATKGNPMNDENRGHSDCEINSWVDGEGRIDLDKLTAEDLETANEFISAKRLLQKLRVAVP